MRHARGIFLFLLPAMVAAGAQPLSAQSSIAEHLRREWTSSRRQIVAIAEAMPAEKYSYKPTPEVRSFGEILTHVAGEGLLEMETVGGLAQPGSFDRFDSRRSRAEILRALAEFFEYGTMVLAGMTDQQALESVSLRGRPSPRWLVVMGPSGTTRNTTATWSPTCG